MRVMSVVDKVMRNVKLRSFGQYPIRRCETLAIISNRKGRGTPEKS